ncbi:MAG: hypothetical protein ACMXYG_02485 [Candidatus Woesearchaeota archaeon]
MVSDNVINGLNQLKAIMNTVDTDISDITKLINLGLSPEQINTIRKYSDKRFDDTAEIIREAYSQSKEFKVQPYNKRRIFGDVDYEHAILIDTFVKQGYDEFQIANMTQNPNSMLHRRTSIVKSLDSLIATIDDIKIPYRTSSDLETRKQIRAEDKEKAKKILYDDTTTLYLKHNDDAEVAERLSKKYGHIVTEKLVKRIRKNAANEAQTDEEHKKWAFRYNNITTHNIAKEYASIKNTDYSTAKSFLAHYTTFIERMHGWDDKKIAKELAIELGRKSIDEKVVKALKDHSHSEWKIRKAAKEYSLSKREQSINYDENTAISDIVAFVSSTYTIGMKNSEIAKALNQEYNIQSEEILKAKDISVIKEWIRHGLPGAMPSPNNKSQEEEKLDDEFDDDSRDYCRYHDLSQIDRETNDNPLSEDEIPTRDASLRLPTKLASGQEIAERWYRPVKDAETAQVAFIQHPEDNFAEIFSNIAKIPGNLYRTYKQMTTTEKIAVGSIGIAIGTVIGKALLKYL